MQTYKAWQVSLDPTTKKQKPAEFIEKEIVAPKNSEIRIRISYSSINYKDALGFLGKGRIFKTYPIVPGIDCAGTVEAVSDESPHKIGDKVLVTGCGLGETSDGGYAECVTVPPEWAIPLPEGLNLREAMILGTAGFTAALCIERMEQNGQSPDKGPIVVTGASGGVGSLTVQMLSKLSYEVIAVSSKTEQFSYLKDLGASKVITAEELFSDKTKPLGKATWAGAIDNLGGESLAKILAHTNLWGNVASVGLAASHELQTTVMPFILRGVSLLGISSANCPFPLRHKIWKRLSTELKTKSLEQTQSKEVPLCCIEDSLQNLLNRQSFGRFIVKHP